MYQSGRVSVRTQGFIVLAKQALEQETGYEPERCIVQTDHPGQIPAGALIVPGAQFAPVEPHTGEKFACEDQAGVGQAAKEQAAVAYQAADRRKEGCHTIDGKHPYGSGARQFQVSSAESVKGREDDFQKPSQQSAVYKVVNHFSHILSIDR